MPHPEHATEAGFGPDTADAMRSGVDGLTFFTSVLESTLARVEVAGGARGPEPRAALLRQPSPPKSRTPSPESRSRC